MLLPHTVKRNILAERFLLEHPRCYPITSTGKFLLYISYWNILAVTLYPTLERPCCTFPSGINSLLNYTHHWNILAEGSLLE